MQVQADWSLYDAQGARKYLTAEEWLRFIESAAGMSPRIHAFCALLAYSGCRVSEPLGLQQDHIERMTGRVRLRTLKRRKLVWRHVPLPPELIALLLSLPVHEDGRLWHWVRQTAYEKVKRVMAQAGIEGIHACPKGLRHSFVLLANFEGIPDGLTQRWVGHAKIETTMVYGRAVGREEQHYAERIWRVVDGTSCS